MLLIPGEHLRIRASAAAPISMECRLHRRSRSVKTGSEFMVGEVIVFHVRDGLCVNGKIDTAKLRPLCRIGGPNYARLGEIVSMRPIAQTEKTVVEG